MHRRYRQIKRAYTMMQHPDWVVIIDRNTDNSYVEFVPQDKLEDWKEKYGDRLEIICDNWNRRIIIC